MIQLRPLPAIATIILSLVICAGRTSGAELERITTKTPFPRGLVLLEDRLLVLSRGRVRDVGGVSSAISDRAGTIWSVDPALAEPMDSESVSAAIENNGEVLASPTAPPFRLFDPKIEPPWRDRETDRPYCTLRYHAASQNLFICAFSGIDKPEDAGGRNFSKNTSDALLRFDMRTKKWHEIERHDPEAGGLYPHHDPALHPPPHGWLSGPDNCLPLGSRLYAVAKENSLLVEYDLSAIVKDPAAGAPPSRVVAKEDVVTTKGELVPLRGHSGLTAHGRWLYLATRTSGHLVRFALDDELRVVEPLRVEVVARFDPFDPVTGRSSDITDIAADSSGRIYALSALPARIFRIDTDGELPIDARDGKLKPLVDVANAVGDPRLKCENLLIDESGRIYVSSGSSYGEATETPGTVYRIRLERDE